MVQKGHRITNQNGKSLERRINEPISFNSLMDKIEISQGQTLKRTKRMKVGRSGNKLVVSAEWVDEEVQFYLKERKDKNKEWRQARNRKDKDPSSKRK